jgi:hypothetical protein
VLPYWLLFSLCGFGAINPPRARPHLSVRAGPLFILAGIAIAIMVGLRFEVGADWDNYIRIFEYNADIRFSRALLMTDPGYMALNWLSHQLGYGIWFVNLICAAIFVWGLIKFSARQPNPWLALAVAVPYLVIVVGMGYTRQAVAVGFIMAGLATLEERSIFRFALYVLAAATVHKSAVAILPLVALSTVRQRLPTMLLLGLLALLLLYVFVGRAEGILSATYIDQEYDAKGAAIRIAMNIVPAAIFLVFGKRLAATPMERKLWRNFSLAAFGSLVLLFVLRSSVVADRLAIYLIPLQLFVFSRLPMAFSRKGRSNGQVILAVLAYSAIVQATWLIAATHAKYWIPYRFYPLVERPDG